MGYLNLYSFVRSLFTSHLCWDSTFVLPPIRVRYARLENKDLF